MGNVFSSCFQTSKTNSEGHRLGGSRDYDNNTTSIGNSASGGSGGKSKKSGGYTFSGSGMTTGGNGEVRSREDMATAAALAAEKRQGEGKLKGIQKGGGKLSKKLESQQKSSNKPDLAPSGSNLQWRVD